MQYQNIKFLKQFRTEDPGLPYEDRQYRNVCFRHFSSSRREKNSLEKLLEERIAHSELLGGLIAKMEGGDLVVNRQLTGYIKKMLKTLSAFGRKEPSSARYFDRLSGEIGQLLQPVELYGEKTQLYMLNTLRGIAFEKRTGRDSAFLSCREVRDMQMAVRQYLEILYINHDVFTDLLMQETDRTGRIRVTSQTGECLLKLTTFIETLIAALEVSFNRLGEWKRKLCEVETQEICN